MIDTQKNNTLKYFTLIAAPALLVMLPIMFNGIPLGNDISQHFQFAETIHQSLKSGEIYPSYDANVNQGYGDYGIRFYPPAAYYLLSFVYLLFGDWFLATVVSFYLIFLVSGFGTFLWAREEFSENQSLIAAALFIFAPYHINQIYNNFLFAEFASSAVLPFCFLFVTRICRRSNLSDILGLSVSYALLILTHLPLTIIGSIALGVYSLSMIGRRNVLRNILKLAVSASLGVGASSFYWIKVITERQWLNHTGEKYFLAIYSYLENFLFRPQNFLNFYTDTTCLWLGEIMLLSILLISIPSAVVYVRNRNGQSHFSLSIGILCVFSLFMLSPLSMFIWDNLDFLQKVQFPWRWLGIASLGGSIFASIGIVRISEKLKTGNSVLLQLGVVVIFSLFCFSSILIVKQAEFVPKGRFNNMFDGLSTQNSFECWWTTWAENRAIGTKEKVLAGDRAVEISSWSKDERIFIIENGNSSVSRIAIFYYPHWKAMINGEPAEVRASIDGAISLAIPKEQVTIILKFEEPKSVRIAQIISLVSLFLMGFMVLRIIVNRGSVSAE